MDFYGEEICAISRYAGISDKVSSFGVYEYNSKYDEQSSNSEFNCADDMVFY